MMDRAAPQLLRPSSSREHQDTVLVGWLPGRHRQDMGQEVSLAQARLRGTVKTEPWDSVISSDIVKFGFIL